MSWSKPYVRRLCCRPKPGKPSHDNAYTSLLSLMTCFAHSCSPPNAGCCYPIQAMHSLNVPRRSHIVLVASLYFLELAWFPA